ncbi:transmembrane protein 144-like [Glandiceps talaboti]
MFVTPEDEMFVEPGDVLFPGVTCNGSTKENSVKLHCNSSTNNLKDVANTSTAAVPTSVLATTNNTDTNDALGFIAAGIAVVFFGSNFVPVKKFESGDGMFFQWILESAIWIVGLIVNMIRHAPTFHPIAMLGGFLWATGNITVVTIIRTIGLGLGLCIWCSLNLLMGWASGRFGWFGLNPQKPSDEILNYVAVGLAVFGVIGFLLVKSETVNPTESKSVRIVHYTAFSTDPPDKDKNDSNYDGFQSLREEEKQVGISDEIQEPSNDNNVSWIDELSPMKKRIIGCVLAITAGCLYGLSFTPCIWIQDNVDGASTNGLDYVFAHFCGIYATGTIYFIIYCILMRNKPRIFPKLILPAFISGVMWAIAQTAFFVANSILRQSVSFPIITTGPTVIAAIWGVVIFKEIRGKRNLLILMFTFAITITGAVMSGLSK